MEDIDFELLEQIVDSIHRNVNAIRPNDDAEQRERIAAVVSPFISQLLEERAKALPLIETAKRVSMIAATLRPALTDQQIVALDANLLPDGGMYWIPRLDRRVEQFRYYISNGDKPPDREYLKVMASPFVNKIADRVAGHTVRLLMLIEDVLTGTAVNLITPSRE